MNDFNKPLQLIDFIKQKKQQFGSSWIVCSRQNRSAVHAFLFLFALSVCFVSCACCKFMSCLNKTSVNLRSMSNCLLENVVSNYNGVYYITCGLSMNRFNCTLIKCPFCSLSYNQETLMVPLMEPAQLTGWNSLAWKKRRYKSCCMKKVKELQSDKSTIQ